MTKYHAKKTEVDGILFDSRREAKRYMELMQLQRAGEIQNLRRQVSYELVPAQFETFERYGKGGQRIKDGRRCTERSVNYVADFVYDQNGKPVVEDVKGVRTPVYKVKRKLMLYRYGIKVKET